MARTRDSCVDHVSQEARENLFMQTISQVADSIQTLNFCAQVDVWG